MINPTATQWALITAGVTAGVVLIATTAFGAGKRNDLPDVGPPDGPSGCDPSPYEFNAAAVENEIVALVDEGNRDRQDIAISVATLLFGTHPTGAEVSFPPMLDALPGVTCVWALTRAMVDAIFIERGLDDEVPTEPGSLEWVLRTSSDPGYPWEEPVMHVDNYPTPGMFVDIGGQGSGGWSPAQGYDAMIKAYLGSALAMAGTDASFAGTNAAQELRKQTRQAVMAVGGFNDLVYGQTNENHAGGNNPNKPGGKPGAIRDYMMNEQGRGLNWLPRHKDNITLIQSAVAPKRATRADGSQLTGANRGNRQMLVWLPALDLDALAQDVPMVAFLNWSDGSSTIDPPPQIRALGIDMSGINLPGVEEPGIGQGGDEPPPPGQGNGNGPGISGVGFAPFP